jgi:hypothetical protein
MSETESYDRASKMKQQVSSGTGSKSVLTIKADNSVSDFFDGTATPALSILSSLGQWLRASKQHEYRLPNFIHDLFFLFQKCYSLPHRNILAGSKLRGRYDRKQAASSPARYRGPKSYKQYQKGMISGKVDVLNFHFL